MPREPIDVSTHLDRAAPAAPTGEQVSEAHVPPFPVDVLPDAAATLIETAASALPCPPDYVGVPLLAAAAAAIGGGRGIHLKDGWVENARLYLPVIGRPGTTKSPAMRVALAPVHAHQEESDRRHRRRVAEWEDAAADKPKNDRGDPPPRPVLHTTDVTVEALAGVLARPGNERGVLVAPDELAGWARSIGQYKSGAGGDRAKWLEAWSGSTWSIERVDRSVSVPHPFVVLTGTMQPDTLASLTDPAGLDDGFTDRMLCTYPDEVPLVETGEGVPGRVADAWADLWRQVRANAAEGGVVRLNSDALAVFVEWSNGVHARTELADDAERGPLAKLRGHVGRLALVLHELHRTADGGNAGTVSAETMRHAITLGEYFAGHFQRVHVEGIVASRRLAARRGGGDVVDGAPITGKQRIEVAARVLHELEGGRRLRLAEVCRAVGRPSKDRTVRRALADLADAGKVTRGTDGLYEACHPATPNVPPSETQSSSVVSKVAPVGWQGGTLAKEDSVPRARIGGAA